MMKWRSSDNRPSGRQTKNGVLCLTARRKRHARGSIQSALTMKRIISRGTHNHLHAGRPAGLVNPAFCSHLRKLGGAQCNGPYICNSKQTRAAEGTIPMNTTKLLFEVMVVAGRRRRLAGRGHSQRRRVGVERSKVQHPLAAEPSPFRVHHRTAAAVGGDKARRRDRISLFLSLHPPFPCLSPSSSRTREDRCVIVLVLVLVRRDARAAGR